MKNLAKISILVAALFAMASCSETTKTEEQAVNTDTATVTPAEPQIEEVPATPDDTTTTAEPTEDTSASTEEHAH
ncbi:MAG TPA: hypothetical protein VIK89_16315 [Cytophagaceae bacterium]